MGPAAGAGADTGDTGAAPGTLIGLRGVSGLTGAAAGGAGGTDPGTVVAPGGFGMPGSGAEGTPLTPPAGTGFGGSLSGGNFTGPAAGEVDAVSGVLVSLTLKIRWVGKIGFWTATVNIAPKKFT